MKPRCPRCGGTYRRPDQPEHGLCAKCWERAGRERAQSENALRSHRRASAPATDRSEGLRGTVGADADPDTAHCPLHPSEPKWECRGCESSWQHYRDEEAMREQA